MGGCSSLSQGPPLPSPPTKSTMSGPANVSSMEARVEFVPEVVGHTRRLTDEYDLGVQIGK